MNSPIVLIHGLWLTPRSWEGWKARYEQRGHEVLAPAWPGMEREVEALRRDPSVMNGLGITEVVDHYDSIIRGLDTPPVIMGHSFGGLITELLLDRGLGAAAVAISPAQIKGVLRLPPAQIRTVWPALRNPANSKKTVPLTPKQFHFRFTNTMNDADARAAYDRYCVPGPGRVLFQAGSASRRRSWSTRSSRDAEALTFAGSRARPVGPKTKSSSEEDRSTKVQATPTDRRWRSCSISRIEERNHELGQHFTARRVGSRRVGSVALRAAGR